MDAALSAAGGVCDVFHTAARVDADLLFAVGVGIMRPILLLLMLPFTLLLG